MSIGVRKKLRRFFRCEIMSIDDRSHVRMNKFLLTCFGLRPCQSELSRRCCYFLFVTCVLSSIVPMAKGLTEDFATDIVIVSETLVGISIIFGSFVQCTLMYSLNEDWTQELFDRIEDDWKDAATNTEELAILERSFRQGKVITFVYLGTATAAYAWFVILNYSPLLLDEKLAEDYSKIFPYYANSWIVNQNLRNVQLCVHLSLAIVYFGSLYVLMIGLQAWSVKHACAVYAIVAHRLRKLVRDSGDPLANGDDRIVPELIDIVIKHNAAIKRARLVGNIFNRASYGVHLGLLITLALLIFDLSFNIKSTRSIFRLIFVAVIFVEHVFYMNYAGEQIIEFSNEVLTATRYIFWNSMSLKARKMLLMIMCRSCKADRFCVGGMTMSLSNFTMIVKISWSLAAALRSTQKRG